MGSSNKKRLNGLKNKEAVIKAMSPMKAVKATLLGASLRDVKTNDREVPEKTKSIVYKHKNQRKERSNSGSSSIEEIFHDDDFDMILTSCKILSNLHVSLLS